MHEYYWVEFAIALHLMVLVVTTFDLFTEPRDVRRGKWLVILILLPFVGAILYDNAVRSALTRMDNKLQR